MPNSYGFIQGISCADDIKYCPACGHCVSEWHTGGMAVCDECGAKFGVVFEVEAEEKGE